MSEVVLVAFISLAGTVMGSLSGVLVSNKLSTYRIEQLEKKMDKHNDVIKRTTDLEKHAILQDEQYKVTKHRLDNLERSPKG